MHGRGSAHVKIAYDYTINFHPLIITTWGLQKTQFNPAIRLLLRRPVRVGNFNFSRILNPYFGLSQPRSPSVSSRMIHSTDSSIDNQPDLVFVKELFVRALTGVDAWHRPQPQPVSISVFFQSGVARAGTTDHLGYSLNYDVISRHISKTVERGKFKTLEEIGDAVSAAALDEKVGGRWARIHIKKPRALLRAESAEIVISRKRPNGTGPILPVEDTIDVVKINRLQLVTIIGVNNIERLHRQNVVINLTLYKPKHHPGYKHSYDFRKVVETVEAHVEDSSYKTVEAFVTSVAQVVCEFGVDKVTVRAEKPSAITFADAAGVEITRSKEYFANETVSPVLASSTNSSRTALKLDLSSTPQFPDSGEIKDGPHDVFIAFGSNVGNTVENVRAAIDLLGKKGVSVKAVSSLYESSPMYVKDQENFLNGVLRATTNLQPLQLLDAVKDIEYHELKRVKEIENGPRSIDLDILLFDDLVMNHPKLSIPHISMLQRSFVLRPLIELIGPHATHPLTVEPYSVHLEQIPKEETDLQLSSKVLNIIPLPHATCKKLVFDPDHKRCSTTVMGILNVTPDSFSDGGSTTQANIVQKALKAVEDGATILDVGGMSTNPKSVDPGVDEESTRVIKAIESLRACDKLDHIPISVDTFRASVADAACNAGADIINDISAGQLDKNMFSVALKHKAPIILNHTRGTPQTMSSLANYAFDDENSETIVANSDEAVVQIVGLELAERVKEAIEAGLPRWQLILDPGLGFAKKRNHSIAIVKNLSALMNSSSAFHGLPWLLGPSRKGFIGDITGEKTAADRDFGTAAVVSCNISHGADIIRVHDVKHMAQVARMSDAIYKSL